MYHTNLDIDCECGASRVWRPLRGEGADECGQPRCVDVVLLKCDAPRLQLPDEGHAQRVGRGEHAAVAAAAAEQRQLVPPRRELQRGLVVR